MNLITDRTEADVLLENDKGVYGFSDLNRVEQAVKEISDLFPQLGINRSLQTKTDWSIPGEFSLDSWPTDSQMKRYLGNVASIKDVFYISLQLPASMNQLTWSGANNIEKVLQTAITRAHNTMQAFRYSGEIFAGEE